MESVDDVSIVKPIVRNNFRLVTNIMQILGLVLTKETLKSKGLAKTLLIYAWLKAG